MSRAYVRGGVNHNKIWRDNRKYENPPEYDDRQSSPHFTKKSQSKQSRDKFRSDQFRKERGAKTVSEFEKVLDKSLYFGFNMESKAIQGQMIGTTTQAKVLPISTRAVGLTTQSMFIKLNQTMKNIPVCTVYEAYRVSLAQVELKLMKGTHNNILGTNVDEQKYYRPRLTLEQQQATLSCPVNFNVISSVVNSIGTFEYNKINYHSRIAKRPCPDPTTILFSNLGTTVKMMSLKSTPINLRQEFYRNNPLPGAKWSGIRPEGKRDLEFELDPILLNPTDYWPDEYLISDFEDDIQKYDGLLKWVSRKSLNYIDTESVIDFKGPGFKTILTSSICNSLRNADVALTNNVIDWVNTPMPSGDLDEFWAPDNIDDTVIFIGALQLLGEIPTDAVDDPLYRVRAKENSAIRMSHRWAPIFNNMMG